MGGVDISREGTMHNREKPLRNTGFAIAASLAAFFLTASAETRFWSQGNGITAMFNAAASWMPAPESMSYVGGDTFVLDKRMCRVATIGVGDSVAIWKLNIERGTLDVAGGVITMGERMNVGGSGKGIVTVSGDNSHLDSSYAIFVGNNGDGELTIKGGVVSSTYAVQFGSDGCIENKAVINLNGGILRTGQVNAHGAPNAVFNWNGGTLQHNSNSFEGGIFPDNEFIAINVLGGGAIYYAERSESFNHPLSGVGAFVLRSSSEHALTLSGAVDLMGGFKVEGGKLVVQNLARTTFKELTVAANCTLDLCGASVSVKRYVLNGEEKPVGDYEAHNGIVRVMSDEEIVPAFVWVVDKDTCVANYNCPEVIQTAAAWYDPSDGSTLSVTDGKVTTIANKGTVGRTLELVLRSESKGGAAFATTAFNGTHSLCFDNSSGYLSRGAFPSDVAANGPRTLFAVVHGEGAGFLSIAQRSTDEEGRSMLLASGEWGKGYQVGYWTESGNWDKVQAKVEWSYDKPYVLWGRTSQGDGGTNVVTSCRIDANGDSSGETKGCYMPSGGSALKLQSFYGTCDVNISWVQLDTSGYQSEALIFTNALSDVEMAEVAAYLKSKWLDPMVVMSDYDNLVVNATVDLAGTTQTFAGLSGGGWFVNGTVVLTGNLVVTVNSDQSVIVPSFDRLVLGPSARLIVKGAKNLLVAEMMNILPFNSIEGRFASVIGENGVKVTYRCEEDHICARRDPGTRIYLR